MEEHTKKILFLVELVAKLEKLRAEGKVIVQSHGVFDLIHPGIIKHINLAKSQGDILVVTVIKDRDVRRGPGRPVFSEHQRAENVASLQLVDYVCIVEDETPFQCVKRIKPDVFARGQSYKERDQKIHQRIFDEEKSLYFGKSRIYETEGFSFSSSQIVNNSLNIYPDETKAFLEKLSRKYNFNFIVDKINSLNKLRVLIIGDGIIDEYHYCSPMGKATKSHLVVNKYITHEIFNGGTFAVANHVAGLCDSVTMVTLLGRDDSKEDFIMNNLKPNIKAKFYYRDGAPTIVKKRYINEYLNQKLFEIDYMVDDYINQECEAAIIEFLQKELPQYDLVLVADFGHGLITKKMIKIIERLSRVLAVNTQRNAANEGYNLINKYRAPHFFCLDEPEARLATRDKFSDIEVVIKTLSKMLESQYFIITLGKSGSIGYNASREIVRTPVFSSKVIDTVGAGDAFYSFTAPCFSQGMPLDLVSFIGNVVGAIAVQIVGNKRSVERHEMLEFINTLLK